MNSAILTPVAEVAPATNMPAATTEATDLQWQAVLARDAGGDGKFVFAVSSTGVYCRLRVRPGVRDVRMLASSAGRRKRRAPGIANVCVAGPRR